MTGSASPRGFPFALVGFDLDGTLLDTAADLGMAINHALALAGRPPVPLETVGQLVGGGSRIMLERALIESGGIDGLDLRALYSELLHYYEANIAVHTRYYPGGEAMLDALEARGCTVAMVTNKLEPLARKLLGELGLLDRFAVILGGDSLGKGRAKPAPDLLHEMVRRCGEQGVTGRAAFVGDTSYDVLAARAANIPCVAVRWGFNDQPVEELGAEAVIDHFDDLVPALERL